MVRRVSYIVLCAALCSCASKKLTTSIQTLEAENKTLRGDVARLQEQVNGLTNDLLVVQSRVENHPNLPPIVMAPAPVAQPAPAPKKMYKQESFLGDDIHFTDDEPGLVTAANNASSANNGSMKFTNKDLANLPPVQIAPNTGGKPAPVVTNEKPKTGFGETTLIADTSKNEKVEARTNTEDANITAAYNRAYKTFTEQNYKDTIKLMGDFLKQYPSHQYSDNAIFWIGESYYQLKNYEQANVEFQKVINKYPNGNKVPDAMLRSGICMLKLSKPEKAKVSFNQLIQKYPESVAARKAKATIGEL